MRPGNGEVIVILDKPSEIRAIKAGLSDDELCYGEFGQVILDNAYEPDFENSGGGPYPDAKLRSRAEPKLEVTAQNVEDVQRAIETTRDLRGYQGFIATVLGRKHAAEEILAVISSSVDKPSP